MARGIHPVKVGRGNLRPQPHHRRHVLRPAGKYRVVLRRPCSRIDQSRRRNECAGYRRKPDTCGDEPKRSRSDLGRRCCEAMFGGFTGSIRRPRPGNQDGVPRCLARYAYWIAEPELSVRSAQMSTTRLPEPDHPGCVPRYGERHRRSDFAVPHGIRSLGRLAMALLLAAGMCRNRSVVVAVRESCAMVARSPDQAIRSGHPPLAESVTESEPEAHTVIVAPLRRRRSCGLLSDSGAPPVPRFHPRALMRWRTGRIVAGLVRRRACERGGKSRWGLTRFAMLRRDRLIRPSTNVGD